MKHLRLCTSIVLAALVALTTLRAQQQNENGQHVQAGKPVITVTDINFGYRPVGLAALISNPFHITNRGNVALRVTKNSGVLPSSMASVFDISDVKTSVTYPFTVDTLGSGANQQTFRIKFTPSGVGNFDATLTFSSNGSGIDSVCRLHGVGIQPGIGVNAVDFGRRRVGDSTDADQEGGPAHLMINNSLGGTNSTISSYTISGNKSEFSWEDLSDLNGKSMAPAQEIIRGLMFKPTKVGYDTLRITFNVSTGSPIVFVATGIGTDPHLVMNDLDFGTVNLGSATTSVSKTFQLQNLDLTTTPKWEFYEDLWFDDAGSPAGGSDIASGGSSTKGAQGFSFDKAKFDLPMFLGAGQSSAIFTAWYQPSQVGSNKATFSLHDYNRDTIYTCKWSGTAINTPNAVIEDDARLSVAPNPVFDVAHLQFADAQATREVLIIDMLGSVVSRCTTSAAQLDLNISALSSGSYILEIRDAAGLSRKNIVKL